METFDVDFALTETQLDLDERYDALQRYRIRISYIGLYRVAGDINVVSIIA